MRIWEVVSGDASELAPLDPGEYQFTTINSPLTEHGGKGHWIVVRIKYEQGITIGRHMNSISESFSRLEGWTIEKDTMDTD